PGDQLLRILRPDALLQRVDVDKMVQSTDKLGCERSLGLAGVAFTKQRLTVEVREFDDIGIDDRQPADPCASKRRNNGAADPTRTDDRDARGFQLALTAAADLRQHNMPRVALELVVGEFSHSSSPQFR